MSIYIVCDDWTGKMEFFEDFDDALARQRERFDDFWTTEHNWHQGNASITEFWIEQQFLTLKDG